MIRQICSIKPEDVATLRTSELLARLQLEDLDLILRERRIGLFGHVERSSGAVRTACDIQTDGRWGTGRLHCWKAHVAAHMFSHLWKILWFLKLSFIA